MVPTLNAQSSSLMEGSGELESIDIPSDNNGKFEQNVNNTNQFEQTKLLANVNVDEDIGCSSNNILSPLKNAMAEENLNIADKLGLNTAVKSGPKLVQRDSPAISGGIDSNLSSDRVSSRNLGLSIDIESNKEALDVSFTNKNNSLSHSISAMSNSEASSTLTCMSKESTCVGLSENFGSESSELNSSMSSSNTTLFAKAAASSVISTDEGVDNVEDKSSLHRNEEGDKISDHICAENLKTAIVQATSNPMLEQDTILTKRSSCNEEDSIINITSELEHSNRTPDDGKVLNLIASAMVDNDQENEKCLEKLNDHSEGSRPDMNKTNPILDQVSEAGSHCSSIESSSKSYELIKAESLMSLSANTAGNRIPKSSGSEEANLDINQTGNTKAGQNSSGHTSGDDLEIATTATSSDIEVISSPLLGSENGNGNRRENGGFKNSEKSPYKGNGRYGISCDRTSKEHHTMRSGHVRSSSEISGISLCSDSADSAKPETFTILESRNNKLQKKISDMTEVLEAREIKLVELSKHNMDLQENNDDLISQVKEARQINARIASESHHTASEEFTQRLSAMEQKLQQIISERDRLKEENKAIMQESAIRMTQIQVDEIILEKDEIISDLRSEGESLSKQVGKQSEIIKKLRQKEKSSEKDLNSTREKLEKKAEECDRLKKSLAAKDEVESRQIEAVRDLTTANTTWQEEAIKRDSELEDATDQAAALRLSLESAFKEISGLKRRLSERDDEAREEELIKEQKLKKELQEELRRNKELALAETGVHQKTIDELRCALASEERASALREEHLRRQRDEVQQRLALSDARHDELSGSVSAATRPLLRQIESLQSSLSEVQSNADRAERGLGERLQQTTIQLASCQERERSTAEQYRQISARLASVESKFENSRRIQMEAESRADALSNEVSRLEASTLKGAVTLKALKKSFAEEVADLKREKDLLETALESERIMSTEERHRTDELKLQLNEKDKRLKEVSERDLHNLRRMSEATPRNPLVDSPTPSLSSISQTGILLNNGNETDDRGKNWMVRKYDI